MKVAVAVLLSCCVALASAGCCSLEDRRAVSELWDSIWSAQFSGRRVAIARAVFEDLFEHAPETKALFKRVNVDDIDSPEFRAHCVRIINGLDTVIHMSFNPATLKEQLSHLGAQHAAREGVKGAYFDLMGDSFERVLEQAIPCFNIDAWHRCFHGFADEISASLP